MNVWQPLDELRTARRGVHGTLALVPTMGALHAGHLSLVEHAKRHADTVWVSVFVNPTQFGPGEDFDRYPRTLDADLAACDAAGVDGVWAPSVDDVYPPGVPECAVDVPSLTADLEGEHRPGHFAGVCRVVAKLLCAAAPDAAVFGRKDYQQWRVIDAMARDLLLPTRILAAPTVYEPDGLAMSSRNRYLSDDERQRALGISRALNEAEAMVRDGELGVPAIEAAMRDVLNDHGLAIDYATLRTRDTLQPIDTLAGGAVALIVARLGATRLLDNRELGANDLT